MDKLLEDFVEGKLNETMTTSEFMTNIWLNKKNLFKRYTPEIVGFDNFKRLFKDEYVRISLVNTLLYTVIVVPVQTFF